jgi:hypothetical protein
MSTVTVFISRMNYPRLRLGMEAAVNERAVEATDE